MANLHVFAILNQTAADSGPAKSKRLPNMCSRRSTKAATKAPMSAKATSWRTRFGGSAKACVPWRSAPIDHGATIFSMKATGAAICCRPHVKRLAPAADHRNRSCLASMSTPGDNLRSAAGSRIRSSEQSRFPDCANTFPVLLFKIPCSSKSNSLFRCAGNLAVTLRICFEIRTRFLL